MPGAQAYGRALIYFFYFFFTYLESLKDTAVSAKVEDAPTVRLLGLPYGRATIRSAPARFTERTAAKVEKPEYLKKRRPNPLNRNKIRSPPPLYFAEEN